MTPEDVLNERLESALLLRAIKTLTPRAQLVISMRFGIGEPPKGLREVGESLFCTQGRVTRLVGSALNALRQPYRLGCTRATMGDLR